MENMISSGLAEAFEDILPLTPFPFFQVVDSLRGKAKLLLLAALAGEHLFLLGSPGTAKSLLSRRLSKAKSSSSRLFALFGRLPKAFERLLKGFWGGLRDVSHLDVLHLFLM